MGGCQRTGQSGYRRASVIHRSPLLTVGGHLVGMLHLRRQRAHMLLVEGDVLRWGWARHQAAAASVVADTVVIDDGDVVDVDVPDDRCIDARNGTVVVEVIVVPIAALIA